MHVLTIKYFSCEPKIFRYFLIIGSSKIYYSKTQSFQRNSGKQANSITNWFDILLIKVHLCQGHNMLMCNKQSDIHDNVDE